MESLPPEILEHLFTFLDGPNERSARLVSLLWFKSVKISQFKFNDLGPNIFSWLMNRLSKYNYPLDISMHIIPRSVSTKQFIDQICRLTQLKSVQINPRSLAQDSDEDYWLKLSTLINLESWKVIGSWGYELLSKFPRLKKIHLPNLTCLPNNRLQLEELSVDIKQRVDLIAKLPCSLNSLKLTFEATSEDHDLNHLTNLTQLNIANKNDSYGGIDIRNITSLQSLRVSSLNIPYIHKNVNLTELHFYMDPYEFLNTVDILEEIRPLTRLQCLSLQESIACNASSNPFSTHSRLTYLSLKVTGDLSLLCDSIKELHLYISNSFDHESLTHLTNLETLSLFEASKSTDYSKYGNFINSFTKLKHLQLNISDDIEENIRLESISNLTDLEQLTLRRATLQSNDYIYLTTLQTLQIEAADLPDEGFNNLSHLKNLTQLQLYVVYDNNTNLAKKKIDYSVISQLPLRKLISWPGIEETNLIQSVAKLTRLYRLGISQINSEDEVLMLTHLQHLRHLEVYTESRVSSTFTRLTQLETFPHQLKRYRTY